MDTVTMMYLRIYNALMMKNERGQGMTEYAVLLAVIVLVVIAAVQVLGSGVSTLISDAVDKVTGIELDIAP